LPSGRIVHDRSFVVLGASDSDVVFHACVCACVCVCVCMRVR
jgi:2C-methyl-D-erythritol 2,4-cyclodiphosphate synthase